MLNERTGEMNRPRNVDESTGSRIYQLVHRRPSLGHVDLFVNVAYNKVILNLDLFEEFNWSFDYSIIEKERFSFASAKNVDNPSLV